MIFGYNEGYALFNVNASKCLDVAQGDDADGTKIQLASCDSSTVQEWNFDAHGAGELRNVATDKCLDLRKLDKSYNSALWSCNGGDGQTFFTHNVPLGDAELGLPESLADQLASWSQTRPPEGSSSRSAFRQYAKQGLKVAQLVARHLGPLWVVRYWDDGLGSAKFVCWGCDRLHWSRDAHDTPGTHSASVFWASTSGIRCVQRVSVTLLRMIPPLVSACPTHW